jgi:hypothetical protein
LSSRYRDFARAGYYLPAFAFTTGTPPNWEYRNITGYVGPPASSITAHIFPIDVQGEQIGIPVNANDAPPNGSRNPLTIEKDFTFVWFDQYIDWSNAANLAKLINADGHPADYLGDAAIKAFGTPHIFLSGDKDEYPKNKGSLGDFATLGTLTNFIQEP